METMPWASALEPFFLLAASLHKKLHRGSPGPDGQLQGTKEFSLRLDPSPWGVGLDIFPQVGNERSYQGTSQLNWN